MHTLFSALYRNMSSSSMTIYIGFPSKVAGVTIVGEYPFGFVVNSAYALLTMTVTYKPTNVVISPFIRYSGTSAYLGCLPYSHRNGTSRPSACHTPVPFSPLPNALRFLPQSIDVLLLVPPAYLQLKFTALPPRQPQRR